MNKIPNIPSKASILSAFTVGYLLIDDMTPAEQNALGNWFMLVAQVLCTSSAQQQLVNNRNNTSTSSNSHVINDDILRKSADIINKEANNFSKYSNI